MAISQFVFSQRRTSLKLYLMKFSQWIHNHPGRFFYYYFGRQKSKRLKHVGRYTI